MPVSAFTWQLGSLAAWQHGSMAAWQVPILTNSLAVFAVTWQLGSMKGNSFCHCLAEWQLLISAINWQLGR